MEVVSQSLNFKDVLAAENPNIALYVSLVFPKINDNNQKI
jgi:hypothetical protein